MGLDSRLKDQLEGMREAHFAAWAREFHRLLLQSGLPRRQADKYLSGCEYEIAAREYWVRGIAPGKAVVTELLPGEA